jgi:adenylate cyclase
LAHDPESVGAQSRLAASLVGRVGSLVSDSAAVDLGRAEGLVARALAAKPRSAYAHFVKGNVLRMQKRWEDAILEYEMALALDRNSVGALHELGWCKLSTGSTEEAIPLAEQAIRLSPRDPDIGWRYLLIGTVQQLQSRTDKAIVWLEKGRSAMPATPFHHSHLASAHALRGEPERPAAELAEARRLTGERPFSSIAQLKATSRVWEVP